VQHGDIDLYELTCNVFSVRWKLNRRTQHTWTR